MFSVWRSGVLGKVLNCGIVTAFGGEHYLDDGRSDDNDKFDDWENWRVVSGGLLGRQMHVSPAESRRGSNCWLCMGEQPPSSPV